LLDDILENGAKKMNKQFFTLITDSINDNGILEGKKQAM
jgi:hypothetical protein